MATHDYVIANGTGAAVRSDLNDALAAIVSNNSSSSAPSTTYAYQWWADTNTNTLKIRNSANNAWITLRELDGTMLMEDGTAAAPGLSFASDTSTGIFRSGTEKINFATNGVERLELANTTTTFNEGGNDVNLRVETSGSANMLFVDGGNDRVGIGTDSPEERLEVQSASNTTIRIDNADDSTAALLFHNTGSTDRQIGVTSGNMTFGGTSTEFARIDGNGRLLVGVSTSQNVGFAHNVQIEGTDGGTSGLSLIRNSDDTNGPHIDFASTRGTTTASNTVVQDGDDLGNLVFRGADGTDKASIAVQIQAEVDGTPGGNDMPGRLVFKTTADGAASPTERVRIDRAGRLLVGTTSNIGSGADNRDTIVGVATNGGSLLLGRNDTAVTAGNNIGKIDFYGNDSNGTYQQVASVKVQADLSHGTGDKPGRLLFAVTADGASTPTDRMRIANDGGLTHFTDTFFTIRTARTDGSEGAIFVKNAASSLSTGSNAFIVRADGDCENTNNAYGAISDAKLKENIVDASSQWDDIKDLRVRNYNFIEGQTHTQIGVVAQEVETVSPGLVSESPDIDDDGNDLGTVTKSVNYSVLYMKAVKALQEAMDRIETLEAKVAALEAG